MRGALLVFRADNSTIYEQRGAASPCFPSSTLNLESDIGILCAWTTAKVAGSNDLAATGAGGPSERNFPTCTGNCRPSERPRSPLNDNRNSDNQAEEHREQYGWHEPLPQIELLDAGHVDRLVVAGAQALSHRQMPCMNGDRYTRLPFRGDVEGKRNK